MDDPRVTSLELQLRQMERRLRAVEDLHDVQASSWRKLAIFALDGWPLRRVVAEPKPRPWHRRFRS